MATLDPAQRSHGEGASPTQATRDATHSNLASPGARHATHSSLASPGARHATLSRRALLSRAANGFGGLALAALLGDPAYGALRRGDPLPGKPRPDDPFAPRPTHFAPRAKRVVFLYMDGGVSQVDSFDPKPRLDREHGQPIGMQIPATQFDDVGTVLRSPWAFRQHGESGTWVSDLFPHVAHHVDELCVVRSMVADFPEHTNANYFLHTGFGTQGRPSMGAWMSYGLGTECRDLPGFVVLNGGLIPPGGLDCFGAGFLPASHQGSLFRAEGEALANLTRQEADVATQRSKLDLLRSLDADVAARLQHDDAVESAIANYELAFRMQAAVPELMGLAGESAATRALYGVDHENRHTASYARQCLLARRLLERGVRCVELTCPNTGHDRWDQHGNLERGHADNALAVDQPIAALLTDLKARGLLDDTLVVWSGEFGRTPMAQGSHGRDHNPHGFSMWMAGGGVRGGHVHGATDDYGYFAVQDKVTMHDLHATILHLLGMDHERLTFRFSGRDMRLTDVHGEVVHELLA